MSTTRNKKEQTVKVIQPEKPIPAEILAQSIVEIASAMKSVRASRLTQRAIVTLIHENSKVPRSQIVIVLNNLESLESTWLKPRY